MGDEAAVGDRTGRRTGGSGAGAFGIGEECRSVYGGEEGGWGGGYGGGFVRVCWVIGGVEETGTDIGFDVASRGRTKLPELRNLVITSLLARFVIYFILSRAYCCVHQLNCEYSTTRLPFKIINENEKEHSNTAQQLVPLIRITHCFAKLVAMYAYDNGTLYTLDYIENPVRKL